MFPHPATLPFVTDDQLIISYAVEQETIRAAREKCQRMEHELERRMIERGATAILNPYYEVKLETPASLDPERLRPLTELIPPEEWLRGFTEAHEETTTTHIPARADLRVVRAWRKYGENIALAIDQAIISGQPRLRITARK